MKTRILSKVNGHTHVIDFDLEATCNLPDFEKYYRLRESNPKIELKKWHNKFDKDTCLHFEIAYSLLKEEEKEL